MPSLVEIAKSSQSAEVKTARMIMRLKHVDTPGQAGEQAKDYAQRLVTGNTSLKQKNPMKGSRALLRRLEDSKAQASSAAHYRDRIVREKAYLASMGGKDRWGRSYKRKYGNGTLASTDARSLKSNLTRARSKAVERGPLP